MEDHQALLAFYLLHFVAYLFQKYILQPIKAFLVHMEVSDVAEHVFHVTPIAAALWWISSTQTLISQKTKRKQTLWREIMSFHL